MIDCFDGPYEFLSNFASSPLSIQGITYPTVEHAFAAFKTRDVAMRQTIANAPTAGKAKRLGRAVQLRPDWDTLRLEVMTKLVRLKFKEPALRALLLATGDEKLVEGNSWNDRFWGVDARSGIGENHLGQILERIRTEIRAVDREHRSSTMSA